MGLGELETERIPVFGQRVDDRTAGITQAQHFGALVERLPHRIVDGLAENLVMQRIVHADNLGIAAGDQQAEIREGRLPRLDALLPDKFRQNVPLEVIHVDNGDIKRQAHRLRERSTDKQRAQEPGTAGKRYRRQVRRRNPGPRERLAHHRHDIQLVRPRRQLRHHPAISLVHLLTGNHIRKQHPILNHRRRRIIAGGLYA